MPHPLASNAPDCAYRPAAPEHYQAQELTRGPWDAQHQHAGPPTALVCGAIETMARSHGLTHLARLTANLLRPVPIDTVQVRVAPVYVGRNAGHFSAHLSAGGKEVGVFTALAQRPNPWSPPPSLPDHPPPLAPCTPEQSSTVQFPFAGATRSYADLMETRQANGRMFDGPCAVWFRLRHPLVLGQEPTPYQRVAVAADSGNGISAILDYQRYRFVNSDLSIHLMRPARGVWICLQSRTWFDASGCGMAESALYDTDGYIGRSIQSLTVRERDAPGA